MNTLCYQGSNQPCSIRAWGRLGFTFHRYGVTLFTTLLLLALFLLTISTPVLAASVVKKAGVVGEAVASDKDAGGKKAVGKLMFTHGQVSLERGDRDIEDNGGDEPLSVTRGDPVFEGDRIITAAASSAQIRFTDGGTMALRPNSEMVLTRYSYQEDNSESSLQTTDLVRGGLRSITGAIGHTNPQSVTYRTPVATIGIRGTIIQLLHLEPNSPGLPAGSRPGTYLMVEQGAAAATTSGTRLIRAGQALVMFSSDTPPASYPADDAVFGASAQGADASDSGVVGDDGSSSGGDADKNTPLDNNPLNAGEGDLVGSSDEYQRDLMEEEKDEAVQEAEDACIAEGKESCTLAETILETEKPKDAEEACLAEGYESCAAKDEYLAAQESEKACIAEGYESCAAKDEYLAAQEAEKACLAEGYESCAAKDVALVTCAGLGYSRCDQMMGDNSSSINPLVSEDQQQGLLFAGLAGASYRFEGGATYWQNVASASGESVPYFIGAEIAPIRYQRAVLNSEAEAQSIRYTYSGSGVTTYLGYWPAGDYSLLDMGSLALLITPDADLVYAAASSVMSSADNITSLMESSGSTFDFNKVADTTEFKPILGDMLLSEASMEFDTADQRLRGGFILAGASSDIVLASYDGVSISEFLASGLSLTGYYYSSSSSSSSSSSETEAAAGGYFSGGFAGDSASIDGIFGTLFVDVPDLNLKDDVAIIFDHNALSPIDPPQKDPSQTGALDIGLLGFPSSLGINGGLVDLTCSECGLGGGPAIVETVDMALEFVSEQVPGVEYSEIPGGGGVYWGYWSDADYVVQVGNSDIGPVSASSLGGMSYIFTDTLPVVKDITELKGIAGQPVVVFNFMAGGDLFNSGGEVVDSIYNGSVALDFDNSSMAVNLDFSSGNGLTGTHLLPDLSGFNDLTLTPSGSSPANFDGGILSGRFAGLEAQALMLMLETTGGSGSLDGRGSALMMR